MRSALIAATFALLLGSASFATPVLADDAKTDNVHGTFLVAPYTAVTVAAPTASIALKLHNYGEAPEPVTLSVGGVPTGWKVQFLGGGQPVGAAMAAPGESVDLTLRLDIPSDTKTQSADLVLHADGKATKAALPLSVKLGNDLPVNLSVKAELPSLSGSPTASYSYNLNVRNDSGKDVLVSLAATLPQGFQASFTKQYDQQEISSLPIKAGETQTVAMKLKLPDNVVAGNYDFEGKVSASGAEASTPLSLRLEGQPKLGLATPDGRLSGNAEAGKSTTVTFVVTNSGTAPATKVGLTAFPPSNWKVEFEPKTIDKIEPNGKTNVTATITPIDKAVAGDYMTTMQATTDGSSANVDYRVSVTTSTMWGIIGIIIIAIALLAVLGAVSRFGRR
ncbi:MAG TPA: NEW3 domain-containing protein [Magnetospirillaceae bacterium]|jgi:uncharacterized membrane protein